MLLEYGAVSVSVIIIIIINILVKYWFFLVYNSLKFVYLKLCR